MPASCPPLLWPGGDSGSGCTAVRDRLVVTASSRMMLGHGHVAGSPVGSSLRALVKRAQSANTQDAGDGERVSGETAKATL